MVTTLLTLVVLGLVGMLIVLIYIGIADKPNKTEELKSKYSFNKCEKLTDGFKVLERCENDEVVCYIVYRGISCIKKELK